MVKLYSGSGQDHYSGVLVYGVWKRVGVGVDVWVWVWVCKGILQSEESLCTMLPWKHHCD